jgi:hypothetical protein
MHRAIASGTRESANELLWQASFALPLEVVEYPNALFTLTADDRVAIALPVPSTGLRDCTEVAHGTRFRGARIRRHLVALATGLAIAAISGSAAGVAAAGTTTSPEANTTTTTPAPEASTSAAEPDTNTTTTTATTTSSMAPSAVPTTTATERTPTPGGSSTF